MNRTVGCTVAAVLLLTAACGTDTSSLPADYHGIPVSASGGTYSPPSLLPQFIPSTELNPLLPNIDATDPNTALAGIMDNDLASQVGHAPHVNTDCAAALTFTSASHTINCDALYDNLKVPFSVTLGGNENPLAYAIQVTQLQGLLVGSEVRKEWAITNPSGMPPLSCDSDLPPAVVVPFDEPTKYRCAVGSFYEHVELQYVNPGSVTSPIVFV